MYVAPFPLAIDVAHQQSARRMQPGHGSNWTSSISPANSVGGVEEPARSGPWLGSSPLGSVRGSEDEVQRLRRQRDVAQEEATALRMQTATLAARVDELTNAKVQLERQLMAAQQGGAPANIATTSMRPGSHTLEEWEKLQLRLHKAEHALEQERVTVAALQRQVESQRSAAETGSHAAEIMEQLRADLQSLQGELALKVSETESLRRALTLGDETVARLKQQLTALLHASEATLTEEQQMETQLASTRKEMNDMRAALQEAVSAHRAAEACTQEAEAHARDILGQLAAQKATVETLMLANAELASRVNIQASALAMVQAECARKDSKLQALESMVERAGGPRGLPSARVSSDGGATAAAPVTTVYDGLTEEQWKLVMLVEAVQSLEVQLAALHSVGDGGREHVISMPGDGAAAAVPDLSLPVTKLRIRIAELAQRMLELEEQVERESQARAAASTAVGTAATQQAGEPARTGLTGPRVSLSGQPGPVMSAPAPQHMHGHTPHTSMAPGSTHAGPEHRSSGGGEQPSNAAAASLPRVIQPFAPQPSGHVPPHHPAPPAMAAPPLITPLPPLPSVSHHTHSHAASVPIMINGSLVQPPPGANSSPHMPHTQLQPSTHSQHVGEYEGSADLDDDLPIRIKPKSKRRGGGSAVVVNEHKRGLWGWISGGEQQAMKGQLMNPL